MSSSRLYVGFDTNETFDFEEEQGHLVPRSRTARGEAILL